MSAHFEAGFGVEIECYLPEGSSMQQAALAVASRGIECSPEGYNHQRRSTWKVVTDGSLGSLRGCEFVSPVLSGEAGIEQVVTVMRALVDFGCTVNRSCGLHVHVGVAGQQLSFFKNLVRLYSMFETVLDSLMPASRRASANMYCRSMTSASPAAIESARSFASLRSVANPAGRYAKVNLHAFDRHQTVEFRQHSGTLEGSKARAWIVLCLRMVAKAKTGFSLGAAPVSGQVNTARVGSKSWQIGQMMMRPEGVSGREVMAALNWPSVSLPQQAAACGLQFTTQRMGREVRYYARQPVAQQPSVAVTLDGLCDLCGSTSEERAFLQQRARNLSGPVAWAA